VIAAVRDMVPHASQRWPTTCQTVGQRRLGEAGAAVVAASGAVAGTVDTVVEGAGVLGDIAALSHFLGRSSH
jgi:hypothetical protein